MSFLSIDSKFMVTLAKVVDYMHLNLLCLVCCLPIVTAGASITAKYYVSMKMVRGEEPVITKSFFRAFRKNFKQATLVWLIVAALGIIWFMDWWITRNTQQTGFPFMQIVFMLLCLLVVCAAFCAFPMLARFNMTVTGLLRSSFIFSVIHLPRILFALFLEVLPVAVGYLFLEWFLVVWLLLSAMALYYNSQMFAGQFKKLEEPSQEQDSDHEEIME